MLLRFLIRPANFLLRALTFMNFGEYCVYIITDEPLVLSNPSCLNFSLTLKVTR